MTLDHFWLLIETAINNYGSCDICPVYRYANETNTQRICDRVGDCADGLMMLHRMLQDEEREKIDIGLTAAKEKVRTEFP